MKKRLIILAIIALFSGSLIGCQTQDQNKKTPESKTTKHENNLIAKLQDGRNVIYFRHTQTETDYADQVTATMGNCATQRVLSQTGWNQAKNIGQAFDRLAIPVQKVYSSEYCRAWKTADLAFGSHEKTKALNFLPTEEFSDEQMAEMKQKVWPLLTTQPTGKQNIVIVGHDDVFEAATGIYPEPQGIGYVLKPDGENFEILGAIGPSEWETF
jgi:broad specificity phosphatase PhoE